MKIIDNTNIRIIAYTSGAVMVAAAVVGFALSFTALSPLVIGGIIAAIPAVLFAAFGAYCDMQKDQLDYKATLGLLSFCAISVAIGVGLGAAAIAIFPGVMLEAGSAALAGLVIGSIALFVGLLTEVLIVEPIVEKVKECFSSKDSQPKP